MRQSMRGGPSGRVWAVLAGAAVAALVLAGPGSEAHAQTFNEAIQRALDNQCQGLSGPNGPYQSSLSSICSAVPVGPGSSSGASIASQTMRQEGLDQRRIRLRLEEERQARGEGGVRAASADPSIRMGKLGLFATGEGEWVQKDVTRFEPGFSSDTGGVIVGADYGVLPWLTAGLALSYSLTHGDFAASGGHFTTDTYGVTLYGSATPLPNLFVDGTLGYTRRDYDTLRRVIYVSPGTAVDGFAQGDTTGHEFRTSVQTGYDFVMRALTVGPRVGVNYSTNAIDAYGERGRNGRDFETGLELAYDRQHRDSLTTTVGAFLSYAFSTSIGIFVPQLTAEWVHEFLDDQRVIYFRFREDLGRTKPRFQTDTPDRDYFNLGTGVILVLPKAISVFVSYRALVGYNDREAHTVSGGLRIGF